MDRAAPNTVRTVLPLFNMPSLYVEPKGYKSTKQNKQAKTHKMNQASLPSHYSTRNQNSVHFNHHGTNK
jgi:hypothetical protein